MNYLDSTERDLTIIVGNYLLSSTAGAQPATEEEADETGTRWLSRKARSICNNPVVQFVLAMKEKDLAMAFASIFTAAYASGVFSEDDKGLHACSAAAAYWAKRGIDELCAE